MKVKIENIDKNYNIPMILNSFSEFESTFHIH